MQSSTALLAIRALGVDIANVMTKCAVFQAAFEELHVLTPQLDLRAWEPQLLGEGDDAQYAIVVPLEQREVIEQILNVIEGLR